MTPFNRYPSYREIYLESFVGLGDKGVGLIFDPISGGPPAHLALLIETPDMMRRLISDCERAMAMQWPGEPTRGGG